MGNNDRVRIIGFKSNRDEVEPSVSTPAQNSNDSQEDKDYIELLQRILLIILTLSGISLVLLACCFVIKLL